MEAAGLYDSGRARLGALLYGRRSRSEMAALARAGGPAAYLDHLALLEPAAIDLTD